MRKPDEAPLKRLGQRDIRSTGWMSDARRCPVHVDLLELCFDETDYDSWPPHYQVAYDHDDNRIRWRCEACNGSWLENFFLEEERKPPLAEVGLVLTCPACSGRHLKHECVPACCGKHRCLDCGTRFDLEVDLLEAGTKPRKRKRFKMKGSAPFSAQASVNPDYRSGWVVPYRRCPEHESPLELVFISIGKEKPTLLAWHCDDCRESWTEPWFRQVQLRFHPEGKPEAECPHCRSVSAAVSNARTSDSLAVCLDCRSTLRLRLVPAR